MYGLIIKKKWLDLIMSGKKTLEIRGNKTSHVGEEIALLESGSQKIRGFCTIKEVTALDKGKWEAHRDRHCVDVPWENLIKRYKTPYAWHLSEIIPKEGLTYEHPKGAVIWVNLDHVSVFKEMDGQRKFLCSLVRNTLSENKGENYHEQIEENSYDTCFRGSVGSDTKGT